MMPGLPFACREEVALATSIAGAAVEVAVAYSRQEAVAGSSKPLFFEPPLAKKEGSVEGWRLYNVIEKVL